MFRRNRETDLLAATADSSILDSAQEALLAQDGVLPFFIHPFFRQYVCAQSQREGKKYVRHDLKYAQGRARNTSIVERGRTTNSTISRLTEYGYLLRLATFLSSTDKRVIGLGEEASWIPATVQLMREIGYAGKILAYPTVYASPKPISDIGSYTSIAHALRLLEPSSVVVGGQYLKCDLQKTPIELNGCVAAFMRNIKEVDQKLPAESALNIVSSPLSFPIWYQDPDTQ